MLRIGMLVAVFILAQLAFLNLAQAEEKEMSLSLCSKWVSESSSTVTTFTCAKNGKSYATGLSFCTTENSQSTVEEMITDLKVTRIFCKPEWSKNAFDCSKDDDLETQACANEYQSAIASN